MRSSPATVLLVGVVLLTAQSAAPMEIEFLPGMANLDDLDHFYAYTWGVDVSRLAGMQICDITLRIEDVTNFDDGPNVLWIHLLDHAPIGVQEIWDSHDDVDEFEGAGPLIDAWTDSNGAGTTDDLVYSLGAEGLLDMARAFAADGVLAFGLDPDCHFWNNGIAVVIDVEGCSAVDPSTWSCIKSLFR